MSARVGIHRAVGLATFMTVFAVPSFAQPATYPLVKLTVPSISASPVIGTALDRNDREILIFNSATGKKVVPIDAVTKLEWSEGRHTRAGSFAKWGAVAGATLGALAGASLHEPGGTSLGVVIGTIDGAMVGGVLGVWFHTYDWQADDVVRRR